MTTKDPKYIDPRHAVPPFVTDLRNEVEPTDGYFSDEDYLQNKAFIQEEEVIEDEEPSVIQVPTSFDIIGQYVRAGADGTYYVDVEIEIPDIDGVSDFEIRTAVEA